MMDLFDASRFITRDCCGEWYDGLLLIYIFSNLTIALCYLLIPAVLLSAPRREVASLTAHEKHVARVVYALFILFCGVGHLEGWLAFTWPNYHLFAVWHMATASVSCAALAITWRFRSKIVTGI